MADLKISQLTDGSPAASGDQIPINRGGTNYRVNAQTIGVIGSSASQVLFNDAGSLAGNAGLLFDKTNSILTLGADVKITRDATNILALRNSTTTQTLRVYNTESSSLTNYERTALLFSTYSTVNYARLSVESAGTGAANIPLVISPKGTGAFIVGVMPDGGTTGGNARGTNAIDIQTLRNAATQVASGTSSVAVGPYNTASATYAVALGYGNNVSGTEAIGAGSSNTVSGSYAVALGRTNTASGGNAIAVGYTNSSSATDSASFGNLNTVQASNAFAFGTLHTIGSVPAYSFAFGYYGTPPVGGAFSYSQGRFAANGDAQYSRVIFKAATTDATPTEVTSSVIGSGRLVIPASKTWLVEINVVARSSGGTSNAGFVRRAMIKRDASNNTALIGSVQTIGTDIGSNAGSPPAGWAISVVADDTSESLDVEVTGAAATNIRWVCVFKIVEVTYA